MTRLIAIAAALAVAFSASFADAKACRDAVGKFTKCPAAAASAKAADCRDAKGKFAKCDGAAAKAGDTASPASPLTPHMNAASTASMAAKPSPMATSATTQTAAAAHPKNCKKGKACGNTCISVKDVCHK